MEDSKLNKWKVDAYVHVLEMEDVMNTRAKEGLVLWKLIEHRTRNDTDVVTLVWKKIQIETNIWSYHEDKSKES